MEYCRGTDWGCFVECSQIVVEKATGICTQKSSIKCSNEHQSDSVRSDRIEVRRRSLRQKQVCASGNRHKVCDRTSRGQVKDGLSGLE